MIQQVGGIMQLTELPLWVLRLIFEELGAKELQTNIGILTVCKRLYNVTHKVFLLPGLRFSTRYVQRFLLLSSSCFKDVLKGAKFFIKSLDRVHFYWSVSKRIDCAA